MQSTYALASLESNGLDVPPESMLAITKYLQRHQTERAYDDNHGVLYVCIVSYFKHCLALLALPMS